MSTITTIFLFIATVKYFHQVLYAVYLLQLKEYRHDRLKEHIERKHHNLLNGWFHLGIGAPLSHRMLPRITVKSAVLSLIGFFIGGLCVRFFGVVGGAFILLFSPVIVLFSLSIFFPIELAVRQVLYRRARAKIDALKSKGLKVVGITGSYGKTTTKNFLKEILSTQFSVLTTDRSINTPLGIARTILGDLKESHEIFIVEMGAYKRGEITELCDISKPDFGIITGISNQHIELFGSQENIILGKSELPNNLLPNGTVFINRKSEFQPKISKRALETIHVVSYDPEELPRGFAEDIRALSLPDFLKANIVPTILLAQLLEIPENLIKKGLQNLVEVEKTMRLKKGYRECEVIDDSRNSSEVGTLAAINFLSGHSKKNKLVVMPCLIELGSKAEEVHENIAKLLAHHGFDVILTTDDYYEVMKKTYKDQDKLRLITDPTKTISYLQQTLDKDWVLLIEGKINQEITDFLTKH